MELSIAKLAIPRKEPVIEKDVNYVISHIQESADRPSLRQANVIPDITGWSATVYTNNSSNVGTRISDLTTGTLWYEVVETGRTIAQYTEKRIMCHCPDGTTFLINPNYGASSGSWLIDIWLEQWYWRESSYGNIHPLTGSMFPYSREIRTSDSSHNEIALPTGCIGFKVWYTTYWAPTGDISDPTLSGWIEGSSGGSGGLTKYRVRAGRWATDSLIRFKQDITVEWE